MDLAVVQADREDDLVGGLVGALEPLQLGGLGNGMCEPIFR